MSENNYVLTPNGELYHWQKKDHKYISREQKNGKWVYKYPSDTGASSGSIPESKTTTNTGRPDTVTTTSSTDTKNSFWKSISTGIKKVFNAVKKTVGAMVNKLGNKLVDELDERTVNRGRTAAEKALINASKDVELAKKRDNYSNNQMVKAKQAITAAANKLTSTEKDMNDAKRACDKAYDNTLVTRGDYNVAAEEYEKEQAVQDKLRANSGFMNEVAWAIQASILKNAERKRDNAQQRYVEAERIYASAVANYNYRKQIHEEYVKEYPSILARLEAEFNIANVNRITSGDILRELENTESIARSQVEYEDRLEKLRRKR